MYQYAYMYENVKNNYMKTCVDEIAYVEGYAIYAQYYAMDHYLDGIDPDILTAYKENELASYCAFINADIGILYEGWSIDEFQKYLSSKELDMNEKNGKS